MHFLARRPFSTPSPAPSAPPLREVAGELAKVGLKHVGKSSRKGALLANLGRAYELSGEYHLAREPLQSSVAQPAFRCKLRMPKQFGSEPRWSFVFDVVLL